MLKLEKTYQVRKDLEVSKDKADLQFDLELDIIDQLKKKYELNKRKVVFQ